MFRRVIKLIYNFLKILDKIISFFSKDFQFLLSIKELIEVHSYKKVKILNKNINFFVPNKEVNLRVKRLFTKEPETINWINNFKNNSNIIFWDIGANIGQFSIYAASIHKNIKVISFEPSTSNLRVLSRNISINKFDDVILINQFPLTNKQNCYLKLNENKFQEGSALNAFGVEFDHNGNLFNPQNSYKIYGTSINYILKNNFLEIPDYIKIDVDGVEHLILQGGNDFLSHKKIKSILIETNEKFFYQKNKVNEILTKNNFKLLTSHPSSNSRHTNILSSKNYIFTK